MKPQPIPKKPLLWLAWPLFAQSPQGVSISPNGQDEPHPAAIFDVQGDDKGVLVPRVSYSLK